MYKKPSGFTELYIFLTIKAKENTSALIKKKKERERQREIFSLIA